MKFIPLFLVLILFPSVAGAATLYLSPGSGSYTVGKAFTVNVLVASSDEPLNAVSGTISVPSDLFTVSSASSVGSIVNFWVQQPQVSGSSVSFEGVVLNPGYQGGGAKVASLVLVPKKVGTGTVSFASAAVLANDGQGTNILDSASGGQYSVKEAAPAPPPVETPQVQAPPPPDDEIAVPPTVIDFDSEVHIEDLVALRGVTYEHATVEVLVYKDGLLFTTEQIGSNAVGDFSVVIAKKLPSGVYEIALRVTREDGVVSVESERLSFTVKGEFFSLLGQAVAEHMGMVSVLVLAIIALLAVLHAYGWRRLASLSREVRATQEDAADITRKVFSLLKKDVASHVKKIQSAGEERMLTKEEVAFLEDFAEELQEAEAAIQKKGRKKK